MCGEVIPIPRRTGHYRRMAWRKANAARPPILSFEELYDSYICRECLSEFQYIDDNHCEKCGKQLSGLPSLRGGNPRSRRPENRFGLRSSRADSPRICHDCANKIRMFTQCRCLITYDEAAREIMADLKYNGHPESADLFGVMAAERLGQWIRREVRPDCLVPVPVHRRRLLTRGYNQAELLARSISEAMEITGGRPGEKQVSGRADHGTGGNIYSVERNSLIPVRTDILARRKNTVAQKELSVEGRLLNLQNAFAVERKLGGERILLIDDIYTTGSTMEACTEMLLRAGAGAVYGLCVCAGEDDRG